MKKSILLVMIAGILFGCKVVRNFTYGESRESEPSSCFVGVPVVADLVVSEQKICYTETLKIEGKMTALKYRTFVKEKKKTLLCHALFKYNADQMVLPLFQVEETSEPGVVAISVSGYPASYAHFRSATQEDEWFLESTLNPSPTEQEITSPSDSEEEEEKANNRALKQRREKRKDRRQR